MRLISFEGCIGSGKTTLANYFAYEFRTKKLLEDYSQNPFLQKFYQGNVDLETEICFLMIHYYQIRTATDSFKDHLIFSDFSIEKDLVYARMNLEGEELAVFEKAYHYIIDRIVLPSLVIYLDVSNQVLKRRIFQRGRDFELNADLKYFNRFSEHNRRYFLNESQSKVLHYNVDDLVLDPADNTLSKIREAIKGHLENDL